MRITRKQAGEAADAFGALLVDAEALERKIHEARSRLPNSTRVLDAIGYQAGSLRFLLGVALESASSIAKPLKRVEVRR